jgi:hypothetical protein
MNPKRLKALLEEMESSRSTWNSHWQDIRDYMMPYRQHFYSPIEAGAKLYTSEALPWFRLGLEQEELEDNWEIKGWLDETEKKFYSIFGKSNFYSQLTECYLDLGGFGTSSLWAEDSTEPGKVHFRAMPLNQCYFMDDQQGRVNMMARVMRLTARQIQAWWPNNLGEKVSKAIDADKWLETFKIVHFVYPREMRNKSSAHAKNMPFASIYFKPDDLHIFDESGFQEFPASVARSQVMEGEVYGRGLGMMALPDTKMLNYQRCPAVSPELQAGGDQYSQCRHPPR